MKEKFQHLVQMTVVYTLLLAFYVLMPIDWLWNKWNDRRLIRKTNNLINNITIQQELINELKRLIDRVEELEKSLGKTIDYCDAATHGDDEYTNERSTIVKVWKGNKKPLAEKKNEYIAPTAQEIG